MSRREVLYVVVLLGGVLCYYIGSEVYYSKTMAPVGVRTLADYVGRFGTPERVFTVVRGGHRYYELVGRRPPAWCIAVPSGLPRYVFDDTGAFQEWCMDPGDSPDYHVRWPRESTNLVDVQLLIARFVR